MGLQRNWVHPPVFFLKKRSLWYFFHSFFDQRTFTEERITSRTFSNAFKFLKRILSRMSGDQNYCPHPHPRLVSIISTDEVFSSQGCVSVSDPFRRAPANALKGCDKEDESDVTFTAFCLPTVLSWSACPFESSKSAARQRRLNQVFFSSILLRNK